MVTPVQLAVMFKMTQKHNFLCNYMLLSVLRIIQATLFKLLQPLPRQPYYQTDYTGTELGHRSIQALSIVSKSELWDNASLTPDEDTFCWGCEVTFSKKANRGKRELTNEDLKPGS